MDDLVPGKTYLIKWPTTLVVLRGKFIKPFDNTYITNPNDAALIDERGEHIKYEFENPLYPYSQMFRLKNPSRMGLFNILSLKTTHPEKFVSLYSSTISDTPTIEYNKTRMWIDLDLVNIESADSMAPEKKKRTKKTKKGNKRTQKTRK